MSGVSWNFTYVMNIDPCRPSVYIALNVFEKAT